MTEEVGNGGLPSDPFPKLANPPIIEVVLDIDCDLPPAQKITELEKPAHAALGDRYPKFQRVHFQETQIESKTGVLPQISARMGIRALQFLHEDEKQLVQIRTEGFTFNRLAPYTTLDDYLPEMERTWRLFVGLASPVQIRRIRLRYINRILLPIVAGHLDLDDYLKIGPRLPDEEGMGFVRFLHQHVAVENATGNQVTIVLASQVEEKDQLPIIFDVMAAREEAGEPNNWDWIRAQIQSLRRLDNRVFRGTLTDKCLELFQ